MKRIAIILCMVCMILGTGVGYIIGMIHKNNQQYRLGWVRGYHIGYYDCDPRKACNKISILKNLAERSYVEMDNILQGE
jgi:hypothetical protein